MSIVPLELTSPQGAANRGLKQKKSSSKLVITDFLSQGRINENLLMFVFIKFFLLFFLETQIFSGFFVKSVIIWYPYVIFNYT